MFEIMAKYGSIIRENVNGAIVPLSAILGIIIGIHMWRAVREYGWLGWRNVEGMGTACILFWVFIAEAIRSLGAWSVLRTGSLGMSTKHVIQWTTLAYLIAGIVVAATFLRCTYFFTPPAWRHKVWIASAIITALFLITSALLKRAGV